MTTLDLFPIQNEDHSEDHEFDPPGNSVWIVAIGCYGAVVILQAPNIHPCFFENGRDAESIGLPFECEDAAPGVYKWTCAYVEHTDWESGQVDDYRFEVTKEECLFEIKAGE